MGFFKKKNKPVTDIPMRELANKDRERAIAELEAEKADLVRDIEEVMKLIAKNSGKRRLGKRRYKLGKGPQDYTPSK